MEPCWETETPREGHSWREGGFSQGGRREQGHRAGCELSDAVRTPYLGILGLGEVNEIWLLPPAALLPLVEAVCQDHTALALEQSTLGQRKHKRAMNSGSGFAKCKISSGWPGRGQQPTL